MNKLPISIISAAIFLASCNGGADKEAALLKEKQFAIDSMKLVMEKKAIVDSMNTVMAKREAAKQAEGVRAEEKDAKVDQAVASNNVAVSPAPAATRRKKGWNHMAKGAVVGAGTGAVTGALVNKNRAEGAIVGTLIGAGVGTATGALVDNSQKKKRRNNN
ncbi:YMGG-like glycine zipper-containing protein [Dyadobacter sp. CY326]|uniref:YMGG-like glycine zipper-containing protein n=1 Tax=Dyadobacter sp. CY326 TaxID=2907300 RepID=UPI001F389A4D|nr:YMGG-like glycine zipper-containing protein [Dyadobacter sp. CY326]MCE7064544.1 glycine zipper domain-containing protein [Dyadobacter sp. CY326]